MRIQLLGANTTSSENRNNKTETTRHNTEFSFYVIRCHFGPLLFALVFAPPSCIGARTLHLSRCSHLVLYLCAFYLICIFEVAEVVAYWNPKWRLRDKTDHHALQNGNSMWKLQTLTSLSSSRGTMPRFLQILTGKFKHGAVSTWAR